MKKTQFTEHQIIAMLKQHCKLPLQRGTQKKPREFRGFFKYRVVSFTLLFRLQQLHRLQVFPF